MLTSLARLLYFLGCSAYYNNLFANTDTLYIPYYWADVSAGKTMRERERGQL
jgi:hypothetical protein